MYSQLNLPELDKQLINFIQQHPTDISFNPNLDRTFRIGIKYRGLIYRTVYCESVAERHKLIQFLMQSGYAKITTRLHNYDEVVEIVD